MQNYEKQYVGKGKEDVRGDIRVTLPYDQLQPYVYEYQNKRYITFTVAKMKEADQFGRSHSVYFAVKQEADGV